MQKEYVYFLLYLYAKYNYMLKIKKKLLVTDLIAVINEKSNKQLAQEYEVPVYIISGFLARNKIKRHKELVSHKICSVCRVDKNISEFRFNRKSNRHRADCTRCEADESKIYYEKNREKILAYEKSPHAKKLNKIRKRKRFFYFKAVKFIKTYNAQLNKDDLALFLWHQWHRQKGLCAITGRKLDPNKCQIDHIIPRTKDLVINDFNNLRWTCKEGNYFKCNMTDDVFLKLVQDVYNHMILCKT
jgi:hypothetical protein